MNIRLVIFLIISIEMQSSGSNIENAEFKALNDWLMNLENLKYVDPCKKQIIESGSNDIDQIYLCIRCSY